MENVGLQTKNLCLLAKMMDGGFTTNRDVKNPLKWLAD